MLFDPVDTNLDTLVGLFDQNVKMSDEVPKYLDSLSEIEKELVRKEFWNRLQEVNYLDKGKKCFDATEFYEATSCSAKDEASARAFFKAVYTYAFEDGEEPDVRDYRKYARI